MRIRWPLYCLICLPLLAWAQSAGGYFASIDSDHDGRISSAEFQTKMSWAFHQMDRNHDNVLEPQEQLVPNAPRLTLAQHHARLAAQFKRQDKNHDGWLSQEELLAPPR